MSSDSDYILGIDLGTNSIGWAMIEKSEAGPCAIARCGVRVFEAGMNLDERGKAESRNAVRREKRLMRRQIERRARRRKVIFNMLMNAGLLPKGDRQQLEGELKAVVVEDPYTLRARALDERLEPHQVGRALYHLAQRRGFQSNRKTETRKKDDDQGKVKQAIAEFEAKMASAGARTWGEYLAKTGCPDKRLRGRYTHRNWYKHEFEQIWQAQSAHHPEIMDETLKARLHKAIFHQRPLKNQKFLIGRCELEPKRPRAPMALLAAQRARYLQEVNHLRYSVDGGEPRELNEEQREALIAELERREKITFGGIRKLLKDRGLPRGAQFNLEAGERKEIKGNTTSARLGEIFGERWERMSEEDKERVVEDVLCTREEGTLARIGRARWGLEPEAAAAFGAVQLEPDYSRHSRGALGRLLPYLRAGMAYTNAVEQAYPDHRASAEAVDRLPPLRKWGQVRNPIVERSLTELRHLVNTLIREHGKPEMIRIELARDLRQGAKERERTTARMRAMEKRHQEAAAKILAEIGNAHPTREDRIKVMLWEECGGQCPYTGQRIASIHELLGEHPRYDVEHIIPFSRCLDNSFGNLTLCEVQENRQRKRNHTPYEAYAGDPERYAAILERVERMRNPGKLWRFKLEAIDGDDVTEEFCERQLNDTRYASLLARDYLALLYGKDWRRHVQAGSGGVTGYLRSAWQLTGKQRTDHRHHAVDAIVIALGSPAWVRQLAEASKRSVRVERFPGVPAPWDGFKADVQEAISTVIVSHRASNRVRGPMHLDSLYGSIRERRKDRPNEYVECFVIRKPVERLSEPEIASEKILDPKVREAIQAAFRECGGNLREFQRRMQDPVEHPALERPDGGRTPIHRVRVKQTVKPVALGSGARERLVDLQNNHHLEIFEGVDGKGRTAWIEKIVTLREAMRRRSAREPIVWQKDEAGRSLVLTLAIGETVSLCWKGEQLLCVVQQLSSRDYVFRELKDARTAKEIKLQGERIRIASPAALRASGLRKLHVTIDGRIRNRDD